MMAGSLNKVTLIGDVGRDPEIRSTPSGTKIANVTLATEERWKDKNSGERKTKTEWHRISIFNPGLVGVVETYVQKGSRLYIEGMLQTRKYTAQDGTERYATEIVLGSFNSQLILLDRPGARSGGRQDTARQEPRVERPTAQQQPDESLDDLVPF